MNTVFTASLADENPMTQFVVTTDKEVTRETIRAFVLQFKRHYYPSPNSHTLATEEDVEDAVDYLDCEGYYWLNETWCLQVIRNVCTLNYKPHPTNGEAYKNATLEEALEAFNADYTRVHNQMSFHDWLELPKGYTEADL